VRIEIWSDVICPWCYLGKRRLETALDRLGWRADVTVVWRSYRLNPTLAADGSIAMVDYMARRYRIDRERSALGLSRLTALAAQDGLDYRLDLMRPANTLDAHRLLHLAADHGDQDVLKERMLRAVLTEGAVIADPATLVRLAGEAGLDPAAARTVLDTDAYTDAVERDEAHGRRHHLESVPLFVFDGVDRVAAARSVEEFERTLRRVAA